MCSHNLHQPRILGFDYMLKRLKARGNGGISNDNVSGTKLAILVKEDLGLQNSV